LTALKDIDYKILYELMRNAKKSDRQLAKEIGVSQPTITRRRTRLEQDVIKGYTIIPNWLKLGYSLFGITLVKVNPTARTQKRREVVSEKAVEWLKEHPNIIMGGGCTGDRADSFMISVHKDYADYDNLIAELRMHLGDIVSDIQSHLVNLKGKTVLKPLDLQCLADVK
jgi:DNA-binding Lrp family transcriptional regulator